MAIWQYQIRMIPKPEYEEKKDQFLVNRDLFFEDIKGWDRDKLNTEFLDKYLEQREHWSESVLLWGNEETTDVQLFIEDDSIEEVSFRIDLRDEKVKEFFEMIINFSKENNAILFNADNDPIDPNKESILKDIKKSASYKFISNPEQFFDDLESKK